MKHSYLNTKEHRPLVKLRFEDESSATLLSLSQSLTRGLIKNMSVSSRAPSEPKATTPQCEARGQKVRGHSAKESLKSYALKGVI